MRYLAQIWATLADVISIEATSIAIPYLLLAFFFALLLVCISIRRDQTEISRLLTDLKEIREMAESKLEARLGSLEKTHAEKLKALQVTLGRIGLGQAAPSNTSEDFLPTGLDKKHHVLSLAERGLTSGEISQKLGLRRGETELVLGLQRHFAEQGINDEGRTLQ